ncbi:prepilin-type N-terminal cleavage/methylation domain-containing protein [Halobacillus litoralis]|uniref:Prepilin-type cleavage/methylation domain-containing protein n=1 Tax=Halobacillus litoralis TaxID=45668 RepID=A0A410MHB3_9BACI|nr:prepilin-type N-terminal cleavage/methylation domain-containing protein [Halobacillus litoralis]QAS54036.1 hypothetical protein HLI_18390 [Halobacillus litoralis]
MRLNNEKGLTLVEVLAVLSLSMVVMIAAYQAFFFITNSIEMSAEKTELRKEANIITLSLENRLINVDSIETDSGKSTFTKFTGSITRLNGMDEETTAFTYIEEEVVITIDEGNLYINGVQQNASDMNLSNTTFELNGNKLTVNLEIMKENTNERYSLVKIFRLGNG